MKLERNVAARTRARDRSQRVGDGRRARRHVDRARRAARDRAACSSPRATSRRCSSQSSVLLVVAVGMTLVILIRGIDLSVGAGVALTGVVAALVPRQARPARPGRDRRRARRRRRDRRAGTASGSAGSASPRSSSRSPASRRIAASRSCCRDAKGLSPMGHDFDAARARSCRRRATWILVARRRSRSASSLTLRDARRRKQLGLEPPTTADRRARASPARSCSPRFVLGVFGSRGMPVPVLVAGAVALVGVFVTKRTRFGRHLYAIGGNPEAARLSGIDVASATIGVYVILGVLTALAGLLARRARQRRHARQPGQPARARRGHRGRHRRHLAARRSRLDRRHRARHARVRDARERHEPLAHRLQLAADLHRHDPARRRA